MLSSKLDAMKEEEPVAKPTKLSRLHFLWERSGRL